MKKRIIRNGIYELFQLKFFMNFSVSVKFSFFSYFVVSVSVIVNGFMTSFSFVSVFFIFQFPLSLTDSLFFLKPDISVSVKVNQTGHQACPRASGTEHCI